MGEYFDISVGFIIVIVIIRVDITAVTVIIDHHCCSQLRIPAANADRTTTTDRVHVSVCRPVTSPDKDQIRPSAPLWGHRHADAPSSGQDRIIRQALTTFPMSIDTVSVHFSP